jgi:hypothetical protein
VNLVPVSYGDVKAFVAKHHRHNGHALPPTWKFGVGIEDDGELVGIAAAGLPKARMLMDRFTIEVNRTCTNGTENANSMLYGAICRAAKALGYRKVITYTLPSESGASLKAAGFVVEEADAGSSEAWETARGTNSYEHDLFGNVRTPVGRKIRWVRVLGGDRKIRA